MPDTSVGRDINIPLPVGCNCAAVDIGSHANQIELPTPLHMLSLGALGCYEFRPTTCVDSCLAPLVQALWAAGVVTTGCCCGHNKRPGYIGIWTPEDQFDATATTKESLTVAPPIPTPDEARQRWGVVVYAGGHDLINLHTEGYTGLGNIEDYADIVRLAAAHLNSFIGRQGEGGFFPECSGDPACCPENEGYGCCAPADARDAGQRIQDEYDARRYRWLRAKFYLVGGADGVARFNVRSLPRPTHIAPDPSAELDVSIDSAMGAEGGRCMTAPAVLDPCCGSRMFWFDKADPRAVFGDCRAETITVTDRTHRDDGTRTISISPDQHMDFRALPFESDSFALVVFDPPHLVKAGEGSWLRGKYGVLDKQTWRDDLRAGFAECFRVLKPGGVLIFKWAETQIKVGEILALTPERPLFGHPSGKRNGMHWVAFMKPATGDSAHD